MSYVRVNKDIVLNFEIKGRGEPLLLISGLGMDRSAWSLQVPSFALNLMTIIFDNRGTGKSDCPDVPYSIGMMARDAFGLLDAVGVDRAHLMGLDMGGRIAMEMALASPSRVQSLLLCSCAPQATPFEHHLLSCVQASIDKGLARDTLARFEVPWHLGERYFACPKMAEGMARVRLAKLMGTPPHAHSRQIQAYLGHDVSERLGQIGAPVLVVAGSQDLLVPPVYQEKMASGLPHSSFVTLDAAHQVTTEAPKRLIEETLGFILSQVPA